MFRTTQYYTQLAIIPNFESSVYHCIDTGHFQLFLVSTNCFLKEVKMP